MNPSKPTKKSKVDWRGFAATVGVTGEQRVFLDEAIKRLENRDVSCTRHGIRVQVRPDLGDARRGGAAAFWPTWDADEKPKCACHHLWRFGMCSHALAARIYERWLEERAGAVALSPEVEHWFEKPHTRVCGDIQR